MGCIRRQNPSVKEDGQLVPVTLKLKNFIPETHCRALAVIASTQTLEGSVVAFAPKPRNVREFDWMVKMMLPAKTVVDWKWVEVDKRTGEISKEESPRKRRLFVEEDGMIVIVNHWGGNEKIKPAKKPEARRYIVIQSTASESEIKENGTCQKLEKKISAEKVLILKEEDEDITCHNGVTGNITQIKGADSSMQTNPPVEVNDVELTVDENPVTEIEIQQTKPSRTCEITSEECNTPEATSVVDSSEEFYDCSEMMS